MKTQPSADREDVLSPAKHREGDYLAPGGSASYDLRASVWSATAKDNDAPPMLIHSNEKVIPIEPITEAAPVDEGQVYETNSLGLIDRIRTEHLYNKR